MSGEELGEGHSKLPWTVDGHAIMAGEYRVGICDRAHAAFIVTAVNSHEKLLACREALRDLLGGDEKMQVAIGGNPTYVENFLASNFNRARYVLQKLKDTP